MRLGLAGVAARATQDALQATAAYAASFGHRQNAAGPDVSLEVVGHGIERAINRIAQIRVECLLHAVEA
jgi:hypothetical protein